MPAAPASGARRAGAPRTAPARAPPGRPRSCASGARSRRRCHSACPPPSGAPPGAPPVTRPPLRRARRACSQLALPSAGAALVEARPAEDHRGRAQEDLQVERERAVLDVVEVELDPLRPRQRSAPVDLGPARDPGLDRQAPTLARRVLGDLRGSVGRGPISDISPRSTLTRFGSSSSEPRRSHAPTRVMRSSPALTLSPAPTRSAPAIIVRSLYTSKHAPFSPTRRCL